MYTTFTTVKGNTYSMPYAPCKTTAGILTNLSDVMNQKSQRVIVYKNNKPDSFWYKILGLPKVEKVKEIDRETVTTETSTFANGVKITTHETKTIRF